MLYLVIYLVIICFSLFKFYNIIMSYNKYKNIKYKKNISGVELVRICCNDTKIDNIYVIKTKGYFSNFYKENNHAIKLNASVFDNDNIASLSITVFELSRALKEYNNKNKVIIYNLLKVFEIVSVIIFLYSLFINNNTFMIYAVGFIVPVLIYDIVDLNYENKLKDDAINIINKYKVLNKEELEYVNNFLNDYKNIMFAKIILDIINIYTFIDDIK